ncbi:hypothetical protein ABFA25_12765 [Mycobacterium lepromatosis]|nr:hypothetical protein [Mycobacterium lepromatosis]
MPRSLSVILQVAGLFCGGLAEDQERQLFGEYIALVAIWHEHAPSEDVLEEFPVY